jgi:DNA polymerase
MNQRGLRYDPDAAAALSKVIEVEGKRLSRRLSVLTNGYVTKTTQAARVLAYLNAHGLDIDSLKKDYLPAIMVRPDLTPHERAILSTYRLGAKTSPAKLKAMASFASNDNRIRGLVQYGGAVRTLRYAGRGPQIHNFPRPERGIDVIQAMQDIMEGLDIRAIDELHGHPMTVVATLLRSCFIPDRGRKLVIADYSSIEARIVAWLAGQLDLLKVFAAGEDVYTYTAKMIGSDNRQLGKVLVLACSYGMGPERFVAAAAAFGIYLTLEQATDYVYLWRNANYKIQELWYAFEEAARYALRTGRTEPVFVGKISFRMGHPDSKLAGHLLMRLPSGRLIVYRDPKIVTVREVDKRGYVNERKVITYLGLNLAKKWTRVRTWGGKFVEQCTQATARDLLADALLRLDEWGIDLDTTIHDEIIAEADTEDATMVYEIMCGTMGFTPVWATGLPLDAKGDVLTRYAKG